MKLLRKILVPGFFFLLGIGLCLIFMRPSETNVEQTQQKENVVVADRNHEQNQVVNQSAKKTLEKLKKNPDYKVTTFKINQISRFQQK